MSKLTKTKLVYVANQIAWNFAVEGKEQTVAATANHIRMFWDSRMKGVILYGEHTGLSPIASSAIDLLAAEK